MQFYYLEIDPRNIQKVILFSERVHRGLLEDQKSTLREAWVTFQNKKDMYFQENFEIKTQSQVLRNNKSNVEIEIKDKTLMALRKGLDRRNEQKYLHF